jgi:hypothetical protein
MALRRHGADERDVRGAELRHLGSKLLPQEDDADMLAARAATRSRRPSAQ